MQAADMPKDLIFKMRIDDEEQRRLERVAAHYGVSIPSMIRMLVKREDDALPKDATPTPKKKR